MITIYALRQSTIQSEIWMEENDVKQLALEEAIWIDLLSPTRTEEKIIEKYLNLDVPTKKEMKEIEPSSRLYKAGNALFMTATMVAKSASLKPKADSVTFILTEKKVITVRYIEPHSFKSFISRLPRLDVSEFVPEKLLIGLLEATIDRLADILEKVSHRFDKISHTIFHSHEHEIINYKSILQNIGANSDLGGKVRESLASFGRLFYFLEQMSGSKLDSEGILRLKTLTKDASALNDYTSFILSKVNLLLDATLGMVNIEQNNIIKIFSVAAVIFLPPTLIASIYGMNFRFMPELNWYIGYPIAIGLMLISAWLPYRYFKKKKWL
ncbi:MAG: magnesium transporter [Gammaproteobacteria bacterium]|nr:MAG: magnesium transporter [Gammaproteobacteria bacterium]